MPPGAGARGLPPGPLPPPAVPRRPGAEGGPAEFRDLQQQIEELRRALEQMRQEMRRERGERDNRKEPGARDGRPDRPAEPKRPVREPERVDFAR